MTHPLAGGLPFWIGDADEAEFLERDLEQRARYFPHGDRSRFDGVLTTDEFLDREPGNARLVRAAKRDDQGWNRELDVQPRDVRKLQKLGFTIGLTGLDPGGGVAPLLQGFEATFDSPAPAHVNGYLSPDGGGYGLHFDTHPVWIFQLEGAKRWTFSLEPEVADPPFNVLFPPDRDRVRLPWIELDRPDTSDPHRFREILLQPGEVLYLPAGCWHGARAEGHSLALTLAMGRASILDVVALALKLETDRSAALLTRRLPPLPRSPGAARTRVLAELDARTTALHERIRALDEQALRRAFDVLRDPEQSPSRSGLLDSRSQVRQMNQATRHRASLDWLGSLARSH